MKRTEGKQMQYLSTKVVIYIIDIEKINEILVSTN